MTSKFAVLCVTAGFAFGAGAALAESMPGNQGSGQLPPAKSVPPDLSKRRIVDRTPDVPAPGERIAPPEPDALKKGFATRVKNRDGSEMTIEPNEELQDAIESEIKGEKGANAAPRTAPDPIYGQPGRNIFDGDDRVRIKDTTAYPFRTIGQLWSQDVNGDWATCSATLIGRSAVITAAHCLYDHDTGGWLSDYEFYPGKDGDYEPNGMVSWRTAHILQGYADNYTGFYGSVVPWDLGVLILDETAGEWLGWMGYALYDPAYDFTANIVGYPGDKPNQMWRSSCEVTSNEVSDTNIAYRCDIIAGTSGSSIYDYDPDTRDRRINGVNIASAPDRNYGLRLNRPYYKWVKERVGK